MPYDEVHVAADRSHFPMCPAYGMLRPVKPMRRGWYLRNNTTRATLGEREYRTYKLRTPYVTRGGGAYFYGAAR